MAKKILHLAIVVYPIEDADKSYIITDEKNQIISIDEAKKLFAAKQVLDCNLALQRLVNLDWSIEKLKQFYKDNPR